MGRSLFWSVKIPVIVGIMLTMRKITIIDEKVSIKEGYHRAALILFLRNTFFSSISESLSITSSSDPKFSPTRIMLIYISEKTSSCLAIEFENEVPSSIFSRISIMIFLKGLWSICSIMSLRAVTRGMPARKSVDNCLEKRPTCFLDDALLIKS